MLLNGKAVAETYKVTSVPTTLWIDRTGRVVDTEIGFKGVEDLMERTAGLLSGGP